MNKLSCVHTHECQENLSNVQNPKSEPKLMSKTQTTLERWHMIAYAKSSPSAFAYVRNQRVLKPHLIGTGTLQISNYL